MSLLLKTLSGNWECTVAGKCFAPFFIKLYLVSILVRLGLILARVLVTYIKRLTLQVQVLYTYRPENDWGTPTQTFYVPPKWLNLLVFCYDFFALSVSKLTMV